MLAAKSESESESAPGAVSSDGSMQPKVTESRGWGSAVLSWLPRFPFLARRSATVSEPVVADATGPQDKPKEAAAPDGVLHEEPASPPPHQPDTALAVGAEPKVQQSQGVLSYLWSWRTTRPSQPTEHEMQVLPVSYDPHPSADLEILPGDIVFYLYDKNYSPESLSWSSYWWNNTMQWLTLRGATQVAHVGVKVGDYGEVEVTKDAETQVTDKIALSEHVIAHMTAKDGAVRTRLEKLPDTLDADGNVIKKGRLHPVAVIRPKDPALRARIVAHMKEFTKPRESDGLQQFTYSQQRAAWTLIHPQTLRPTDRQKFAGQMQELLAESQRCKPEERRSLVCSELAAIAIYLASFTSPDSVNASDEIHGFGTPDDLYKALQRSQHFELHYGGFPEAQQDKGVAQAPAKMKAG